MPGLVPCGRVSPAAGWLGTGSGVGGAGGGGDGLVSLSSSTISDMLANWIKMKGHGQGFRK